MKNMLRRLGRLEERLGTDYSKPSLRFVVALPWKGPINWAASTCDRTRDPDGGLTEVVHLEGDSSGISKDELDRFIARFPIQAAGAPA
jgi:hypothetical protein